MKMSQRQMLQMRLNGATYQEIADALGVSRQCVHEKLIKYDNALKGMRRNQFYINRIVYKGIYDYFKNNPYESVTSFAEKIYGYNGNEPQKIRKFITGEAPRTYFSIERIQRMCKIVGMPFEKVFERRCEG